MNSAGSPLPEITELVAINPARNIRRYYSIAVSIDLFGAIIVETRWGRLGARGQAKRLSFSDPGAAEHYIRATLRRRSTAESRIGVPYRPTSRGPAQAEWKQA